MKIINSIHEITSCQDDFPIFFWDKWKTVEEQLHQKQYLLCVDDELNVVPFTVYTMNFFRKGDYLYAPLDKNGNRLSVEKEKQFLDEFHTFLKMRNIVDVMFPPSHIVVFKAIPQNSFIYPFGIIQTNLKHEAFDLYKKCNENTRRDIKKAEKIGVQVMFSTSYIDQFWTCYEKTRERENIEYLDKNYLKSYLNILWENVLIGISVINDKTDSSMFFLYDKKNVYYLYSGYNYSTGFKGSNKYLYWQSYLKFKNKGIEKFYPGGYRLNLSENDKLSRIQNFKLKLGGEIEYGYHFIKIIHPIKYYIITFAMRCKSILTGKDCSFINLKGLEVKKSK